MLALDTEMGLWLHSLKRKKYKKTVKLKHNTNKGRPWGIYPRMSLCSCKSSFIIQINAVLKGSLTSLCQPQFPVVLVLCLRWFFFSFNHGNLSQLHDWSEVLSISWTRTLVHTLEVWTLKIPCPLYCFPSVLQWIKVNREHTWLAIVCNKNKTRRVAQIQSSLILIYECS